MNKEKAQKYREQHRKSDRGMYCVKCTDIYPCDVINILDDWQFEHSMQKIVDISEELGLPE